MRVLGVLAAVVAAAAVATGNARALSFAPGVQYGVGLAPNALATCDVNGDGNLDVVTANETSSTVSVLLGNGDGTFDAAVDYPAGPGPADVVCSDFNGDGLPDLATADYNAGGDGSVAVMLGQLGGTFAPPVLYPTPVGTFSLWTDGFRIVTANTESSSVSVLDGNGDGTFKPRVDYPTGTDTWPWDVTGFWVDPNDSTKPFVLVTANYHTSSISVLQEQSDGTFGAPTQYPSGAYPIHIEQIPYSSFDYSDVVTADHHGDTVSILRNNLDGSFGAPSSFPVGPTATTDVEYPASVTAPDVDQDDYQDLVAADFETNRLSVRTNNNDGTFASPVFLATGAGPADVASRDLNGDGMPDLVSANQSSNTISVFLNTGNLLTNPSFETSTSGWGGVNASLSRATDGHVSHGALKVAYTGGGSFHIYPTTRPVSSTASATYTVGGWFRSNRPGLQVCMLVREAPPGTSNFSDTTLCFPASTAWQPFGYTARTAAAGDTLTINIRVPDAQPGDSFEVDALTLTQAGRPDTTPPDTSITNEPSATVKDTTAGFVYRSSELGGGSFQCSLDGASWAWCGLFGQRYAGLAPGQHTFQVRAVDPAGNVDPTPASWTWTVDVPQNLLTNGSFESGTNGWYAANASLTSTTLAVGGAQAVRLAYSGSGGEFHLYPLPRPVSSAAAGASYVATGWLRSDTPGRKVCLVVREAPPGTSNFTDASSCLYARNDWDQFDPVTITPSGGDTVTVNVIEEGAQAGDSFDVDALSLVTAAPPPSSGPAVSIDSGPSGTTTDTSATFAFSSTTAGATFECTTDFTGSWSPCTSPVTYTGVGLGNHSFSVRATANGVTGQPAVRTWTVETANNLLTNGSFESGTSGWYGVNAALSTTSDAMSGTAALHVAYSGSGSEFHVYPSPRPVQSAVAGATYTAGGFVRANPAGQQVCLVLREAPAGTSTFTDTQKCVTATGNWQAFPNVSTVASGGDTITVNVVEPSPLSGVTFDLDALWLTASGGGAPPNLLANGSFENGTSGWYAVNASLSTTANAEDGAAALHVAYTGSGTEFHVYPSPRPVQSANATTYTAGGWIRSDTPGRQVCLVLREAPPGTSTFTDVQQCVTTTTSWQAFPSASKLATAGDTITVNVVESSPQAGDTIDLDGLTLTAG